MTLQTIIKTISMGIKAGISYGVCLSLGLSYCFQINYTPAPPRFVSHFSQSRDAMTASVALWMLVGILFHFASLFFKIPSWSQRQRTVAHCLATLSGLTCLGWLAGWFSLHWSRIFLFWAIFIVVYCIYWLIYRRNMKQDIQVINTAIKQQSSVN